MAYASLWQLTWGIHTIIINQSTGVHPVRYAVAYNQCNQQYRKLAAWRLGPSLYILHVVERMPAQTSVFNGRLRPKTTSVLDTVSMGQKARDNNATQRDDELSSQAIAGRRRSPAYGVTSAGAASACRRHVWRRISGRSDWWSVRSCSQFKSHIDRWTVWNNARKFHFWRIKLPTYPANNVNSRNHKISKFQLLPSEFHWTLSTEIIVRMASSNELQLRIILSWLRSRMNMSNLHCCCVASGSRGQCHWRRVEARNNWILGSAKWLSFNTHDITCFVRNTVVSCPLYPLCNDWHVCVQVKRQQGMKLLVRSQFNLPSATWLDLSVQVMHFVQSLHDLVCKCRNGWHIENSPGRRSPGHWTRDPIMSDDNWNSILCLCVCSFTSLL